MTHSLGNLTANEDRGDTKSECQNIGEYLEAGEVHLFEQNGESLHVGLTVRWVPHLANGLCNLVVVANEAGLAVGEGVEGGLAMVGAHATVANTSKWQVMD